MTEVFQLGDVVVLKSGGPRMTVCASGDAVSVEWFSGDTAKRREYPVAALLAHKDPPADVREVAKTILLIVEEAGMAGQLAEIVAAMGLGDSAGKNQADYSRLTQEERNELRVLLEKAMGETRDGR